VQVHVTVGNGETLRQAIKRTVECVEGFEKRSPQSGTPRCKG
jgi:hypothetical protein